MASPVETSSDEDADQRVPSYPSGLELKDCSRDFDNGKRWRVAYMPYGRPPRPGGGVAPYKIIGSDTYRGNNGFYITRDDREVCPSEAKRGDLLRKVGQDNPLGRIIESPRDDSGFYASESSPGLLSSSDYDESSSDDEAFRDFLARAQRNRRSSSAAANTPIANRPAVDISPAQQVPNSADRSAVTEDSPLLDRLQSPPRPVQDSVSPARVPITPDSSSPMRPFNRRLEFENAPRISNRVYEDMDTSTDEER